jgi:hypothetical protein
VADLSKELEALHASVVRAVRERVENGSEDEDGNYKPVSNDDLRVALQLLKQNAITANLAETDTQALKSKMAAKLNFSALQEKVVPLRSASLPHTTDEPQQA